MHYKFPAGYGQLSLICDHMDGLDVNVIAITKDGDHYIIETEQPIPEEQLEHLEMVVL